MAGGGASVSSFEREGEFGPGLALAQDDFLLLLLLLLPVLLQLHALLVDLSLLLHNSQLILGQFGLSFSDLAVILLQDFFQLLPLGFFFFLDGRDGAMLAHEQALVTTTVNIRTHKPLMVSHTPTFTGLPPNITVTSQKLLSHSHVSHSTLIHSSSKPTNCRGEISPGSILSPPSIAALKLFTST